MSRRKNETSIPTSELPRLQAADAAYKHVVTRINDGWYVCDECGQAGSERRAILHQFPAQTPNL